MKTCSTIGREPIVLGTAVAKIPAVAGPAQLVRGGSPVCPRTPRPDGGRSPRGVRRLDACRRAARARCDDRRGGRRAEALRAVAQQSSDLIITDDRMPVMGDLEVIRTLRAHGMTLPILAISGCDSVITTPWRNLTFRSFRAPRQLPAQV